MEEIVIYKVCKRCGKEKSVSDFHKDRTRIDGLNPYCKQCIHERADWKSASQKETRRKWVSKKYHSDEGVRLKVSEYNKSYRERNKVYFEEYYKSDKFKESLRRSNEKRLSLKKQHQYFRDRRVSDKNFAISCSLRARMANALKRQEKFDCSFELIGCTIEELKRHLESQFTDGMNWDNYGGKDGWQIDHIVPCSYFDLSIEENQYICFNFRNLQPLWAKDNNYKKNQLPINYIDIIKEIRLYLNS